MRARADRKASGHDCRAARTTLCFDVEVSGPRPLGGEFVDARCWCTARDAATITADLAVAEVVHEKKNNIWLRRRLRVSDRWTKSRERRHAGVAKCGHCGEGETVAQQITSSELFSCFIVLRVQGFSYLNSH